jgi:GT2 family glycosyltransferase
MKLSYVLITRNRRDRLLKTLRYLGETTPLPDAEWEAIVVDNASDDGTIDAITSELPWVRIVALPENQGMPARNHGVAIANGQCIAFLDDDSYPVGDTVTRALAYLSQNPQTAAIVGRIILPSGGLEAAAFPGVTLGGASIVRKCVLDEIGGFSPEFFRQAEEYDLSFRIWQAGYKVERFEDLIFRHDKDAAGRSSSLTHKMDLRNNLILVERYLPQRLRGAYRGDWIRRYGLFALQDGHPEAVNSALREAREWAGREASTGRRTLSDDAVEHLFQFESQAKAVAEWARARRLRRVVIADYSKNIYATFRACRLAGLQMLAVTDGRLAFAGRFYRGIPILPDEASALLRADGIVLSTVDPARVDTRMTSLKKWSAKPILRLWEPRYLDENVRHDPAIAA